MHGAPVLGGKRPTSAISVGVPQVPLHRNRNAASLVRHTADDRQMSLLRLLDLSADSMLLERLWSVVGLTDSVLDWVRSFLTDRMQQIAYSGLLSSVHSVPFGVPQGSVLGPLLYVLALVVDRHGLSLHQYTDDTQVYISTPAGDAEAAVRRLNACLVDIEAW